jgi:hypothetical protein
LGQGQLKTMEHQKLRSDLRKLHGELRRIKSVDDGEQMMLRLLDSDIAELLAREGANLKPEPDARQRISDALARVEASNPRVTLLVTQMVDSLAYLGI